MTGGCSLISKKSQKQATINTKLFPTLLTPENKDKNNEKNPDQNQRKSILECLISVCTLPVRLHELLTSTFIVT